MSKRSEFENSEAWHNRGFLPHYDVAHKYQMITYRLVDSLPQEVLAESAELHSASSEDKDAMRKRKIIEKYLDKGYGSCLLKEAHNAQIVVDAWKFFDGERYDLIAYVVMPNHVHVLIKTYENYALGHVVQSWKTYTAKEIKKFYKEKGGENAECNSALPARALPAKSNAEYNSALPATELPGLLRAGEAFWQREYWDRFIRDEKHFTSAIQYILENPVKAGLVSDVKDWPWSYAVGLE